MNPLRALGAGLRTTSLENPSTPLTAARLLSEIDDPGQLWQGESNEGDPLRVGAAFRCVQILGGTGAGCPLRVTRHSDLSQVQHPALHATSSQPGTTAFELWEQVIAHIALWGNAYIRKVRARDGRILQLVPIHPARVTVDVVDGRAAGLAWAKRFTVDGKVALTEYDVMHVPGLTVNGVTGLSVIGNVRRMFGLATAAEKAAARLYEKGLMLSGFLTTDKDLSPEKADILKERWRAKLAGVDNAQEVAVLDKGMKFEQLSMSPADAQFLETRKFQTTEIARMFGVPGWMVNDQEKSTSWGTGIENQFTAFVVVTLKQYLQRIEQRVTREVCNPAAEKAEFKVEGLLRGDSKARAAFYASGITYGWMVPNEARELEDLPPVTWGDEPYLPFNQSASSQTGTDATPGGDDDDDA